MYKKILFIFLNKNFSLLKPECKILGVTATPVRSQRETFLDARDEEWTREQLMSDVYEDIVCGIGIDELIDKGFLVDEQLLEISVNTTGLKTDSTGEFTNDSINEVFEKINLFFGGRLQKYNVPRRSGDPYMSLADISNIKYKLFFKPSVSFEEGLKKTYAWWVNENA